MKKSLFAGGMDLALISGSLDVNTDLSMTFQSI